MNNWLNDYKLRYYGLVGLFILLFFASWKFAFQKSLNLISENRNLRAEINQAKELTDNIPEMENYLNQENQLLKKENNISQSALLDSISQFAQNHQLLITNFQSPITSTINNLAVEYEPIEFQGSYDNILKLTYYIEEKEKLRTVNHLSFFIYENSRTKETNLRAKLYLLRPVI